MMFPFWHLAQRLAPRGPSAPVPSHLLKGRRHRDHAGVSGSIIGWWSGTGERRFARPSAPGYVGLRAVRVVQRQAYKLLSTRDARALMHWLGTGRGANLADGVSSSGNGNHTSHTSHTS